MRWECIKPCAVGLRQQAGVTVDRRVTAGSERRLQKHRDAAADDRCKRRSQIPSINAEPHPPRRCNANVLDESEWRQRFDVGRHRGAILGAQLRSIVYDLHHWPTYPVAVHRHAGRKRFGDFWLRPLLQLELGNIREAALAIGSWTAGKTLSGNDGADTIASAVAFGTVAGTVNQIGTAIPLRGL